MNDLSPELRKLESIQGTPIPDTTFVLSQTLSNGIHNQDAVAQVTAIHPDGDGVSENDHFFRLSIPGTFEDPAGAIEVDETGGGLPRLTILAKNIFSDEPGVLGTMIEVALVASGVHRAVVEANSSDLPPGFLSSAGGQVIKAKAVAEHFHGPIVVFEPAPRPHVDDHGLLAA